jgi:hypothetical protein
MTANSEISYYLERLRAANDEGAYDALVQSEDSSVPMLIDAYYAETSIELQADLVEIVWKHRLPETLDFLSAALRHDDPRIWKNALDGMVAIGGQTSIMRLETERSRLFAAPQDFKTRLEWIDEAIQQIVKNK